jgi:hypothetical protein
MIERQLVGIPILIESRDRSTRLACGEKSRRI